VVVGKEGCVGGYGCGSSGGVRMHKSMLPVRRSYWSRRVGRRRMC
jgi:hypothetical protein